MIYFRSLKGKYDKYLQSSFNQILNYLLNAKDTL